MSLLKAKANTPNPSSYSIMKEKRLIAQLGSNDNSNKTENLPSEDIRT
jgi:hypothetical protein